MARYYYGFNTRTKRYGFNTRNLETGSAAHLPTRLPTDRETVM
jgi:hypothetical protein